jgi:serine/threonine protein kinase
MAPEQVEGRPDQIGPAVDIYSLGVVMYQLLTGQVPHRGDMMAMMMKIVNEIPSPPRELRPDLDERLQQVCLKMMARDVVFGARRDSAWASRTPPCSRWPRRFACKRCTPSRLGESTRPCNAFRATNEPRFNAPAAWFAGQTTLQRLLPRSILPETFASRSCSHPRIPLLHI